MIGEWQAEALCRPDMGEDPELFFSEADENSKLGKIQRTKAKEVCGRCPVQTKCLEWALATRQTYGVWGGMSENDRLKLRGRRIPVGSLR